MNPLAFGAKERTPDPRDFQLGTIAPDTAIPNVFIQDWSKLAVEFQGKIPACGAHAGAFLKDVQETIETGMAQRKSPPFLWKKVKQIDGSAPEDGTDMLSLFKVLKPTGVCDFNLTGNDVTVSLAEYTNPSTINSTMEFNALNSRIGNYAFTFNPSMDQIKQAIYNFKAVLMLIRVGEEFWKPSWSEADILPLRPPASPVGGHFVVAHSYDEKRIYFRNSWGETWGRKGDGYFEENYIPHVVEIGTAFDVKGRFNNDLSYWMANPDVFALQKFLVANGFGSYAPTGFFGDKTLQSVKAFQAKYGIPQTGYVGPLTRNKLNQLYR